MTGLVIFIALTLLLWWFLWQQAKDAELHAHGDGHADDGHAAEVAAAPDDFTKIEGVGPAIAKLFVEGSITTFAGMAKASAADLQKILDGGGSRFQMADPGSWPQQADLAAKGDWDALKKWQDELDGGR